MPDNFTAGEADSDTLAPPAETMGARYGISVKNPIGRGAHEQLSEPYLMPNVQGRNGGYETFLPAVVLAPTDGLNPEDAIASAVPVGEVGAAQAHAGESMNFAAGISDATF